MKRIVRTAAVGAAAIIFVFAAREAQAARVFVSGSGTDSGTCSRTAPCRSFSFALTQAGSGGEIVVLDSAGYGPVTISQSITITNPSGVEAGITPTSGGDAITIDASAATTITLRGLTLDGGETGASGIAVTSASLPAGKSTLNIIDCVIKNFANAGISLKPTSSASPTMDVLIQRADVLHNSGNGIDDEPTGVTLRLSADHVTAIDNGNGIVAGSPDAVIVESDFEDNAVAGVSVLASSDTVLKHSTMIHNVTDVASNGTVTLDDVNTLGSFDSEAGDAFSDGTNNVGTIVTNPLTKESPQ